MAVEDLIEVIESVVNLLEQSVLDNETMKLLAN